MMSFILETLQVLFIEIAGVACTAGVLYLYWKGMTAANRKQKNA